MVPRGGGIPPGSHESQHKADSDDYGRDACHGSPPPSKRRVGVLGFEILVLEVVLDGGGHRQPCGVMRELVADDNEADASDHPNDERYGGDIDHLYLLITQPQ